jgi:AcrR family transcriptional regulator
MAGTTHPALVPCTSPYRSEYVLVHPRRAIYTRGVDSVKINDELLIPAGRHTLKPDEVSARQRERLLRAMGSCVSEQGYLETTIADIVKVARTSRTVFYKHFADKEECFLQTYLQMTGVRIKASLDAAALIADWRGKLDAGIGAYFLWMAEHPEVAVTTVVEVHSAGRRALAAREEALKNWMRTVESVGLLAAMAGEDVELPPAACPAIILTAEAYVHEYACAGRLDTVIERAPEVQALARALFEQGRLPVEPSPA